MTRPSDSSDLPRVAGFWDLGPLRHEVARRAHQKWQARGCPYCDDVQDWLEAEDELCQVLGSLLLSADLTPRVQTHAECQQLQRYREAEHSMTRILAESATVAAAAPRVLSVICDGLGLEAGVLWAVDQDTGLLRCVAVRTAPKSKWPDFVEACRQTTFPRGVGLAGRVWDQGAPLWVADTNQIDDSPVSLCAWRRGLHGLVAFPIRNGTEFLGVMEFFTRKAIPPDAEFRRMMISVSGQMSQFIERREAEDRLRGIEEEWRIAHQVQQGLLPRTTPTLPGFSLCGRCWPARNVGGDCFDFIPMVVDGEQCLGVVVGDASGHGVAAALLISETRAYLRAVAMTCSSLGEILRLTNNRLSESSLGDHFVTLLVTRFDPRKRALAYAGAGHCPGYVLDTQGEIKATLRSGNLPLGIHVAGEIEVGAEIALNPGDLVFLYSDGITETPSPEGELYGTRRALQVVRDHCGRGVEEIVEALYQAVQDFGGHQRQRDDITAVVIKVDALPSDVTSCGSEYSKEAGPG